MAKLGIDWNLGHGAPKVGDVFRSTARRPRFAYEVKAVRKVRSAVHPNRWSLTCDRLPAELVDEPDWEFTWYKR